MLVTLACAGGVLRMLVAAAGPEVVKQGGAPGALCTLEANGEGDSTMHASCNHRTPALLPHCTPPSKRRRGGTRHLPAPTYAKRDAVSYRHKRKHSPEGKRSCSPGAGRGTAQPLHHQHGSWAGGHSRQLSRTWGYLMERHSGSAVTEPRLTRVAGCFGRACLRGMVRQVGWRSPNCDPDGQ